MSRVPLQMVFPRVFGRHSTRHNYASSVAISNTYLAGGVSPLPNVWSRISKNGRPDGMELGDRGSTARDNGKTADNERLILEPGAGDRKLGGM